MKVELGHTRMKLWDGGTLYITPTLRFRWHDDDDKLIEILWLFIRISVMW